MKTAARGSELAGKQSPYTARTGCFPVCPLGWRGIVASVALLVLTIAGPAGAQRPPERAGSEEVVNNPGFLSAHQDLLWRRRALRAYGKGYPSRAAVYLQRAAKYADKPSQATYAEMLWNGDGVERDRALAYVWMDLAAERGYRLFVAGANSTGAR
jgi:hypothetical protein